MRSSKAINSSSRAVKVKTELGQLKTLGRGPMFFKCIKKGQLDLFLGLGPDPEIAVELARNKQAFYIECPMFMDQMGASWRQKIPATFSPVSTSRLNQRFLTQARIWLYLPALNFFPGFWTKVLAICRLKGHSQCTPQAQGDSQVFIFGSEHSLLVPDICDGLKELNLNAQLLPPDISAHDLAQVLNQTRPKFFLSINFQGIDPLGENLALIERCQIPIAVWCVDNPFHILTRIKGKFWQKTVIFVTDSWFIPYLKKYGGQRVFYLPLATSRKFFYPYEKRIDYLKDKVVFVGRSEFPHKDKFFAATRLEANLSAFAQDFALQGIRPDFEWWLKQLEIPLWPGNKVRHVGYNAEVLNLYWRKVCLQALARTDGLVVYGDKNWKNILPANVHFKEEIDYYGPLSQVYTSARYVLNLTSLLLPSGLTQRHFDVWAAGGFLITDYTPGLKLFSWELTSPITFHKPDQIEDVLNRLERQPGLKKDIQSEFHKLILTRHTYRHRLEQIFDILHIS